MAVIEHDVQPEAAPLSVNSSDPDLHAEDPDPILAGYMPLGGETIPATSLFSSFSSSSSSESESDSESDASEVVVGCPPPRLDPSVDWDVDAMLRRQLDASDAVSSPRGRRTPLDMDWLTKPSTDFSQADLWNESVQGGGRDIPITPDKVKEITACMSNFKLPPENIPSWARDVSGKQVCLKQLEQITNRFTSK